MIEQKLSVRLAALFAAAGVILRLIPHPVSFWPVTALALFAGAHLRNRWGILALLGALLVSDAFLGFHATMPFTWGATLIVMALGRTLSLPSFSPRILMGGLGASLIYFFLTNLGVFFMENLYPHTWAGLAECFRMALPFYRVTLAGDLVYTVVLFGVFHAARAALLRRAQARA